MNTRQVIKNMVAMGESMDSVCASTGYTREQIIKSWGPLIKRVIDRERRLKQARKIDPMNFI